MSITKWRDLAKRFVPKTIKHTIKKYICKLNPSTSTFSLCGEDRILSYLFSQYDFGFYVDIGAYNPIDCSNTYLFYEKGWRGINIDARPGSMDTFKRWRPRDINLEVAIANQESFLTYYQLAESVSTMNSFSKEFLQKLGMEHKIVSQTQIKAYPLSSILDQYLPPSISIDFLSVDVEGMDLEVLKSNNWEKYRPKVVLVESIDRSLDSLSELDIVKYMNFQNYECLFKTPNGLFLLDKSVPLHSVNCLLAK